MPGFDDIISANRHYAETFTLRDVPGRAGIGLAIVTCMDSRIDPLAALGLEVGDAKIIRNPGGQVTDEAMTALVLAVNLLGAERVAIIEHTKCAMASNSEKHLQQRITDAAHADASTLRLGAIGDQHATLRANAEAVAAHPFIGTRAEVAGFVYDVDTGLLEQVL